MKFNPRKFKPASMLTFVILFFAHLVQAAEIKMGPYVQFLSQKSAVLVWQTEESCAGTVTLKSDDGMQTTVLQSPSKTWHQVVLKNLKPYEVYTYQIEINDGEDSLTTEEFVLEQKMNYSLPDIPGELPGVGIEESDTSPAEDILFDADIFKGYAAIIGSQYYPFAYDLAKQSDLSVIMIDTEMKPVQKAREMLQEAGAYGTRVNVRLVDDLTQLPVTPNFANLILAPDELNLDELKAVLDILRPSGGTAYFQPISNELQTYIDSTNLYDTEPVELSGQEFTRVVKKKLPGSGEWTHQYANPANNANGGEQLSGASKTTDLSVQWVGKPGANFGIDRNPRMPAPLAVNGRIFHQGMNRMVALDFYNGQILWSLEIPHLRRVNLPHDCSNWCANDEYIFTAIKEQAWKIAAEDGTVQTLFELPDFIPKDEFDWGFIANVDELLYGSGVKKGTIYTEFFGHETWYDQQQGSGAEKVCGEYLFALDHNNGETVWQYEGGAVIHSTITIADGHVYFVESRNPEIRKQSVMRIGDDLLWTDQYLVKLDAKTGKKVWEQPIDTVDGKAVFFMIHGEGKLLVSSSADGSYHFYAFDPQSGNRIWENTHKWTDGDHSGHMQHPLIVSGAMYVEPCGYDINTGERITENVGLREGCATYAAVANALIYRGQGRNISMWDRNTEEVSNWVNLRPSCWLSVVPAGGMVLAPEGGGGCSCGNWIETSLGFMPIAN